jgi:hypothetical protein
MSCTVFKRVHNTINGYQYNRWEELLEFIADGSSQYSAVFDVRTYTTAMIACHEAQQWQKVNTYYNILKMYLFVKISQSFECVVYASSKNFAV